MKVGIDSYCYHRYFGEIYPDQTDPGVRWTFQDFVRRAAELGVDGVSLESCFFESLEPGYLAEIKAVLDEQGPGAGAGLGTSRRPGGRPQRKGLARDERADPQGPVHGRRHHADRGLVADVPQRAARPADRRHRDDAQGEREDRRGQRRDPGPREPHRLHVGRDPARSSSGSGSDALKVNFDTGNTLRMMEDPVAAARRLGPYTVATHTKDVDACRHVRPEEWYFFSSVPVGTGLIDMPGVVRALQESGYTGRAGRRVRPSQGQPGRGPAGRREHRVPEDNCWPS